MWCTKYPFLPSSSSCKVFANGKKNCLRVGKEHTDLKLSQIERGVDPDFGMVYYSYVENGSKNRRGCDIDVRKNKVKQNEQADIGLSCHVYLLDLHLSKLRMRKSYIMSQTNSLESRSILSCFWTLGIAMNIVATFPGNPVKYSFWSMSEQEANKLQFEGWQSYNAMFQAGIPEKRISERTGHQS